MDRLSSPDNLPPVVIKDTSRLLISIVTPSFNQGRFIRETIESILAQDYPNIEYWVIDGGSTDETISILKEYEKDPRFHWISEPDKGQADAINKGWSRCRGDILAYLNSDDTYLPSAFSRIGSEFLLHPEIDIIYGDALRVEEDGTPIEMLHGAQLDLVRLLRESYLIQPSVFQRRKVVQMVGPLRRDLYYTMDFHFYLQAMPKFSMLYVPQIFATYRMHATSKTTMGGSAFASELFSIINQFLQSPLTPAYVRAKGHTLQSDWSLKLALLYLQERRYKKACRCFMEAMRYNPFRPRIFFVTLQAIDSILGTSLYTNTVSAWKKLKGRISNA